MTPEKHIVDAPTHMANTPWYIAALFGVFGSINSKLEPVSVKWLVSTK